MRQLGEEMGNAVRLVTNGSSINDDPRVNQNISGGFGR